jgi:hypothetical protein
MHEATPPLPNMFSWRGAYLSTGITLPFPIPGRLHESTFTDYGRDMIKITTVINGKKAQCSHF